MSAAERRILVGVRVFVIECVFSYTCPSCGYVSTCVWFRQKKKQMPKMLCNTCLHLLSVELPACYLKSHTGSIKKACFCGGIKKKKGASVCILAQKMLTKEVTDLLPRFLNHLHI